MSAAADLAPAGLRVSVLRRRGHDELLVLSYAAEPDLARRTALTLAEAEVAALAIRGLSNAAIAEARGTSGRTVANQMAAVLRKLGIGSRRELAARYVRGELPTH